MSGFTSVEEIKRAVDAGRQVRWENDAYHVIKDTLGQYLVEYVPNGSCIGLTWRDGVTLNGKLDQFYEEAGVCVQPMARRAKFHEARNHFAAGGRVLVSEYGHEPFVLVTDGSTTHSRDTTTWDELAATVRMWRNRYPNQRFYVVEEAAR